MSAMTKENLKMVGTIAVIFLLIMAGSALSEPDYEATTKAICKEYHSVPESHVDRIPDGCIADYYQSKEQL